MSNENHKRVILAVARCAASWCATDDDIDIVCELCKVTREELQGVKVTGYRIADFRKINNERFAEYLRELQEVEVE